MAEPESPEQVEPPYQAPAVESLGSTDRLTGIDGGSLTLDGTSPV